MTRQRSLYYEHIQNSNELAQSLIIDFLSHWSSSLLLHRSTPHSLVSNSGTSKNPIVHYFLLTFFSFLLLTQISSVLFCSVLLCLALHHLFCLPVTVTCAEDFRYPAFLIQLDPSLELTEMSSKAVRGEMINCCSCCWRDLLATISLSSPDPIDEVTDTKEWESSSSYLLPSVK